MDLSVIIPTRNRGAEVALAVRSVLESKADTCDWEIIVIDQSNSVQTHDALRAAGMLGHPKLVYHRTQSVGASRARNEGVKHARGEVLAFVDDDCRVTADWVAATWRRFAGDSALAMVYASVVAAPNDEPGWTPEFRPVREGYLEISPRLLRGLGFSANLAVRASAMARIGSYDPFLGPGTRFGPAEDTDLGIRALRLGYPVYAANGPEVIHHGHRLTTEIPRLAYGYSLGMAAMFTKHVRCGDLALLPVLVRDWIGRLAEGTRHLIRGQRPSGYRGAVAILHGVLGSYAYGVDRNRRLYRPWRSQAAMLKLWPMRSPDAEGVVEPR